MEEKKLREIIKRVLSERFQDDDLGAFSGDFDEFDFDDAAMQAAKKDIEASGEEFEDLGKSKFEKKADFKKKFKSDLKRANLDLPSDEQEVERLAQVIKDRGEHEKKFGAGTLNEQDFDTDMEGSQPGDVEYHNNFEKMPAGLSKYSDIDWVAIYETLKSDQELSRNDMKEAGLTDEDIDLLYHHNIISSYSNITLFHENTSLQSFIEQVKNAYKQGFNENRKESNKTNLNESSSDAFVGISELSKIFHHKNIEKMMFGYGNSERKIVKMNDDGFEINEPIRGLSDKFVPFSHLIDNEWGPIWYFSVKINSNPDEMIVDFEFSDEDKSRIKPKATPEILAIKDFEKLTSDDERELNEDDTLDTTSLYNFLKDALYKYDSLNLDYAEAAKELETALTSKFDVISRDKMSFSLNENIERPTDSEGNQIKLKSLVKHKDKGLTGRVERFIVGDDNKIMVKVMWMEDIHHGALPPKIVSTQDIIVIDQTSSLNELYNFNDNDFLEVLIGDAGLDYMKSESPDILEFDVIEAIYIFRHDHNEDHPFLHYLNKIVSDSGFKPNPKLSSYGDLDDAGKILYDELVNNEEIYKEKYLDGAFGYEFLEESGVRSHASGRGQNSKPSSFPDNLKRDAIREGKEIKSKTLMENYEVFWSDGIRSKEKIDNLKRATIFAKELSKRQGMKEVEIFKATPGFHSTTQDEFLVSWWGDGSYWDNVSKKNPEILKKKMESVVENNQQDKEFEESADKELFYVTDDEFNKIHYPDLIGKTFETPPSYAKVKVVKQGEINEIVEESTQNETNWKVDDNDNIQVGSESNESPREFTYYINLDERGEFNADVRDESGNTVLEIGSDDFEMGIMKHKHDHDSLKRHLIMLGIMKSSDNLVCDETGEILESDVEFGGGENSEIISESWGDRYEKVMFAQGQDADHALDILMQDGEDAALEYLKQWHYPGEHDASDELGHGTLDDTYEKDGYIMNWNSRIGYIGLQYDTQHNKELDEDSLNRRHIAGQRRKKTPLGKHSPHSDHSESK